MTEAELERAVWGLVKLYRLDGYHTHNSQRSQPGFPDWVIVGKRIMFRELKSPDGAMRPAQIRWLYGLRAAGADAEVWRPRDLASGRIAAELAALKV